MAKTKSSKALKIKPKFIQTVAIAYYGNHGMRPIEDCIALASNIALDLGYESKIVSFHSLKGTIPALTSNSNLEKGVEIVYPKNILELLLFLYKEKPTVVFGNTRTLSGFLTCFFGKYTIFMSHQSQNPLTAPKRMIFRFFARRFDALKVETPYAKEELVSLGVEPKKIFYIPIPIDIDFFSKSPNQKTIETLRKKYHLKKTDILIYILCHIRSHKKVYTIMNAAKILSKKYPSIKFIFIGKDLMHEEKLPSLNEKAKELGISKNVIVTGRIPETELRDLMHMSIIGLQSSSIEGQCLSVYEMASAGLPLCLSTIGSFTSVFKKCALFHDPDDHVKLAQNVETYLHDKKLRDKNAAGSRKEVVNRCSEKKIRAEMRELIRASGLNK